MVAAWLSGTVHEKVWCPVCDAPVETFPGEDSVNAQKRHISLGYCQRSTRSFSSRARPDAWQHEREEYRPPLRRSPESQFWKSRFSDTIHAKGKGKGKNSESRQSKGRPKGHKENVEGYVNGTESRIKGRGQTYTKLEPEKTTRLEGKGAALRPQRPGKGSRQTSAGSRAIGCTETSQEEEVPRAIAKAPRGSSVLVPSLGRNQSPPDSSSHRRASTLRPGQAKSHLVWQPVGASSNLPRGTRGPPGLDASEPNGHLSLIAHDELRRENEKLRIEHQKLLKDQQTLLAKIKELGVDCASLNLEFPS